MQLSWLKTLFSHKSFMTSLAGDIVFQFVIAPNDPQDCVIESWLNLTLAHHEISEHFLLASYIVPKISLTLL